MPLTECEKYDPDIYQQVVHFNTFRPLHNFCRLGTVGWENRCDNEYNFDGQYRKHEHHAFFQYTVSGVGIFNEHGREHLMTSGKGFLCRAADADTKYFFSNIKAENWEFIWISFLGDAALALVDELVQRYGYIFHLPLQSPVLSVFEEYRGMSGLTLELEAAVSARIVCEMLLGLEESARADDTDESSLLLVKKALRLVRENLSVDINVGDLARQLGVSREHLSRIFREQTGVSPYRYIVRQKMLRACRMLKETELNNKEISVRLGYGSVENFSRLFKNFSSMTPGNYRKYGFLPVEQQ